MPTYDATSPAVDRDAFPATPAAAVRDRPATLTGSALWLLGSNLAYAGCQWATVVALAKVGVPASLGYFGLALAVATPVVLLTGFALRAYQATDVLRRYAFADYLGVRMVANVAAAAIIAGVATAGVVEPAVVAILIPIGVAKLAEATSETCYGLAQRHDRMRFVALSKMLRGGLGLAALVAVVAGGGSLAAGSWALAAAWTGFLLVVDLPMGRTLEPLDAWPRAATLWRLAATASPLGVVTGVSAMTQSVPRYLLQHSHGAAAVGYFTALAALGPALSQLASAVCHAAAPSLGRSAAGDGRRYRGLVLRLLGAAALVTVVLGTGAAAAGRPFLALVYAPDYAAYHRTFVVIVLAAGLGVVNTVAYFALLAARRLGLLLAINSLGLAVTALAGALLIPRFGVEGGALGIVLGGAVMALASVRVLLAPPGASPGEAT